MHKLSNEYDCHSKLRKQHYSKLRKQHFYGYVPSKRVPYLRLLNLNSRVPHDEDFRGSKIEKVLRWYNKKLKTSQLPRETYEKEFGFYRNNEDVKVQFLIILRYYLLKHSGERVVLYCDYTPRNELCDLYYEAMDKTKFSERFGALDFPQKMALVIGKKRWSHPLSCNKK